MGSAGSPPRDQSSPGKARRPAGSIHPSKRGDDRYRGTSGNAKELWRGVRQSERSIGAMASTIPMTDAHENASGHRQPGETCAQETAMLGSQGTNAVHGTWVQRRRRRASSPNQGRTGPRDSEPGARPAATGTDRSSGTAVSRHGVHHARPSPGCGDAGTGVEEPQPAQCPWGGPGHLAGVQGQPGNQPGGMTRATRQRHVLSATGCSPTDPQKPRHAATARASGPSGQERGQGRGDAVGGDRRAGLLRLLLRLAPRPQPASRPA